MEDLIVALGDYIDCGPDSRGVLDTLISLHRDFNKERRQKMIEATELLERHNYFEK